VADNFGGIVFTRESSNNSVTGNNIVDNRGYRFAGISLEGSSNNSVIANNIANNSYHGILLEGSYDSVIGNNIVNNGFYGLWFWGSSNNSIIENNISNNQFGIYLTFSSGNRFFHNNVINNTSQIPTGQMYPSINVWDNGLEGNYWSNYTGEDLNHDGIGDNPYVIDSNNTDHCPLTGQFTDFSATPEYHVQTVSNSTVSDFRFNGTAICFNVSGENGAAGFCRICIPTALMNNTYKVLVNGSEVQYTFLPCSNSTHSYLYFNYAHSTKEVVIIPEVPSFLIMPLFMVATLYGIALRKKRCLSGFENVIS
jgi:parallel beta-helix repeat protein